MHLMDIRNSRIQQMVEKLRPYNITTTYVKSETNYIPDRLSRNPRDTREAQEIETPTPTICNKSLRVMNDKVTQVVEGAKEDDDYTYILQAV